MHISTLNASLPVHILIHAIDPIRSNSNFPLRYSASLKPDTLHFSNFSMGALVPSLPPFQLHHTFLKLLPTPGLLFNQLYHRMQVVDFPHVLYSKRKPRSISYADSDVPELCSGRCYNAVLGSVVSFYSRHVHNQCLLNSPFNASIHSTAYPTYLRFSDIHSASMLIHSNIPLHATLIDLNGVVAVVE